MKFNLNESEKNRILDLHKKSNSEYLENNLLSEVNDMFRLMRIERKNGKSLFSESIVPTGGLKEIFEHIDVLKPLMKELDSEYIEGLTKNVAQLSEELQKRGITDLTSLITAAREFADANKGILKKTTDDAKELVDLYFKHTGILGEIRKGLQNKIIGKIQQETNEMLEKFKTALEGLDNNINNSPYEEFYTTSKNLSDGVGGDLDNLKNNIVEIDRINKEIDEALSEVTSYRTNLGPMPKKGTPEYAQYTKYSRYIEELNKLKQILTDLKITTIIVTHDSYEAFYLGTKCGIILDGQLKQYDDPYNVYHFPNSIEVVNFLNRGILIPAKVTGENSLENDDLGTITGDFIKHYPKGSEVQLLLQPEDLEHDDKSNLKLEVVDRKFRGTNFIYTLKTASNRLVPVFVHSHHIHQHEVDEKFGIKRPINIDHIVCF